MRHARLLAATALSISLVLAGPASAQLFGGGRQDAAIAALQQEVATINQRLDGAPGQPGLATAAETARGELDRARSRIDDLEESLRSLNGTVEGLTTELAQARQANQAAGEQNQALLERLARIETALQQQAAAPPPQAVYEDPPTDDPGGAAAEEEPVAAAPPPPTADGRWSAARALFQAGEDAEAGAAYEGFIRAYPRDPRLGEANHQLAETRFRREDWQGAAAAYAASLRGWPQTGWAAESTIKLALALGRLDRGEQACQSLAEFTRRYAPTASARGRQRAAAAAQELSCS